MLSGWAVASALLTMNVYNLCSEAESSAPVKVSLSRRITNVELLTTRDGENMVLIVRTTPSEIWWTAGWPHGRDPRTTRWVLGHDEQSKGQLYSSAEEAPFLLKWTSVPGNVT